MDLHPFRHNIQTPGVGGEEVRLDTKDLALTAVSAALYVAINVLQGVSVGNPTIYGPVQLRVADALIPLAALLGWPVVAGVAIGGVVTNFYYFLGVQDVVLGPIANLVAAFLIFHFRRHRLAACVLGALCIGIVVGGYLWVLVPPPEILNVLPVWAAMIVSITISSLVAIAVLGYLLLSTLSRKSIMEPLKSKGLKVPGEESSKAT